MIHLSCLADWIVGLPDTNICDETTGKYYRTSQLPLVAYSAGSFTGDSYLANGVRQNPPLSTALQKKGVISNYGYITITTDSVDGPPLLTAGTALTTDQTTASPTTQSTTAQSTATNPAPTTIDSGSKEDDGSVCFPANSMVLLETGEEIAMSNLSVGHRVHVGYGTYSPVFMFTHKLADTIARFVQIETATGHIISLTSSHYLYINSELAAAKSVVPGDKVELEYGAPVTVTRVSSVLYRGLYNPQTIHGDIVVSGVRASTYTTKLEPVVAHAALSPLRAMYLAFRFHSAALEGGAPRILEGFL